MSTIHIVKVTGKNRADLIKALQGAIRELGGDETPVAATDFYTEPTTKEEDSSDEMIDEPSPFGNSVPQMGNVTQLPSTPSVSPSAEGVDSEGLPWDKRIHASSKEKIGNGTWRKRRGIDDETYFKVKQELRGVQSQVPATPVIQVPNQPTHAFQTPVQPVGHGHSPQPQQTPPMPQMQTITGGHSLQTFQQNFAHVIAALITEKKLSPEYIQQLCQYFGIAQIWMASLAQQEEMFNTFTQAGIIQRVG